MACYGYTKRRYEVTCCVADAGVPATGWLYSDLWLNQQVWQKWNQRCERPHYIRQFAHDHIPFDDRSENLTPHRYVHCTLHDRVCHNIGPLLITIFAIRLRTITFHLAPSRSSSWSPSKMFPYKNSHFPSLPANPIHLAQHYGDVLTSGRHEPIFFLSPQHPDQFWDPTDILING